MLSERIYKFRRKSGFSQEQLAEKIYAVEIRNESGDAICRGRIEFAERDREKI